LKTGIYIWRVDESSQHDVAIRYNSVVFRIVKERNKEAGKLAVRIILFTAHIVEVTDGISHWRA